MQCFSVVPCLSPVRKNLNLHLPLDVVLQQVLIDGVQVVAAHVVVVVSHCVAELLAIGPIFHIVGLVAVVVIIVTLTGQKQSVKWTEVLQFNVSLHLLSVSCRINLKVLCIASKNIFVHHITIFITVQYDDIHCVSIFSYYALSFILLNKSHSV